MLSIVGVAIQTIIIFPYVFVTAMNNDFANTPENLQSIAADIIDMAIKSGADMAEASAAESVGMELSVRRGALDEVDFGREQELSVTAYCNGGSGTATIGELSKQTMQEAVRRAVAIAKTSASDPYAGLAEKEEMATDMPDLDLFHPWQPSVEEALALALTTEESAFAVDGEINRDKSDGASVHTSAVLSAYANSRGFCAAERATSHTVSASALAERDGAMQQDGWSETRRNAANLPSATAIGKTAGERALRLLGGGKIGDGRANVLFQAPVSHSLIGHLVGAASGGALYRKASWLLDKFGEQILPANITIRECPRLQGEMRSAAYDGDGVATQTRDIVAAGTWCGRFLSAYSARRLGAKSTGNAGGAHNLEVDAALTPADNLPAMVGRGLIVTELMGQGVNSLTGDYSRGAAGFWVENGEIVYPVSEVTIAGNLHDMLGSIAAIGDDTIRRGLVKCGSLLLPDMTIGGNR